MPKWTVAVIVSVVVIAGIVVGILSLIGNSDVCKSAVEAAQKNSEVTAALGTPIEKGMFVSGKIEISGPSGHAELAIPVSGPKGKGKLYAIADKKADIWTFETLELAVEGGNRVDLLPKKELEPQAQ